MNKVIGIIRNVLFWILIFIAVFMMVFTIVSVSVFDNSERSIFGCNLYIVQSDSMSKTDFDAGDLIISKKVKDPSKLKEGDIISYISQNSDSFGETITHKIRSKTIDAEGNPGFITYGTTTGVDDSTVVTYNYILGKYSGKIPNLGTFFFFLKQPQGYIICIFIPFVILILIQGLNCIKIFRKYKQEQLADMQAQRDQIEEERRQSAEMLKELQALKAQLAEKNQDLETSVEDDSNTEEDNATEENVDEEKNEVEDSSDEK